MFFEEKSVKVDKGADIARNHACRLSSSLVSFVLTEAWWGKAWPQGAGGRAWEYRVHAAGREMAFRFPIFLY